MGRVGCGLLVLAGYAAIVVFLTWPLAPHAATHLPQTTNACRFDNLYSGWALAHETTALLTDPGKLAQGNHFYPDHDTLFYGPTAFGALPYFAPVFAITGNPTLALNVTLLLSIVLTAGALHFVVWRWTGSHLGGLVAACSFLLTRWTLWSWLPTAPHAAVLQYFPLIILLAATPSTALRHNLVLFGLVVLQCLTELVYVAPAVLVPLAVLGVARLARRDTRAAGATLLGIVALAGLVLLVPAAGHLRIRAANPDLMGQGFWRGDQWFREAATELPWDPLLEPRAATALPSTALALLSIFALSRRERKHRAWGSLAWWAGIGFLLSLTPIVSLGGHRIALPQSLLAEWMPIYRQIREPARLGVAALMSLAMLAGIAFAGLARRIAEEQRTRLPSALLSATLAAVVVAAMYVEYRANSPLVHSLYPIGPAATSDDPFLALLRRPGGPLLEIPAGVEPSTKAPAWHAQAMYRSIEHRRSLLNGYSSYWPAGFARRMALADRLPDRAALAELRRETGLALLWVHTGELPPTERASWALLADGEQRDDLRLIARDGDQLLFATEGGF